MKRIDIFYGGEHYSVGGRDFTSLSAEITGAIARGGDWLRVNADEGRPREAFLLLSPGVPLALVPIPETPVDDGETPWEDGAAHAETIP